MKWHMMMAGLLLAGCAAKAESPRFVEVPSPTLSERRAMGLYQPTSDDALRAWEFPKVKTGEKLDLDGYYVTFEDNFSRMSVTDGNGNGPWFSPVHSDFGAAHFVGPRPGKGPVFVRNGKLVIQMYEEGGKWISGLVQTVNKDGKGFAQQYGYFEMRAKMAAGKATWGGLWLHSHPALTGPDVPQSEIDVAEVYGGNPPGHHKAVHLWPVKNMREGDITKHGHVGQYNKLQGMFDDFHTYGVLITPEWTTFYYDRVALARLKTIPETVTPQYILIDMTRLPKMAHEAKGVMELEVDYVKVWQKR